MIRRQCYIRQICQQKETKEIMGYPKKHRGRRKKALKKEEPEKRIKKNSLQFIL